jgi:hypothetical protein
MDSILRQWKNNLRNYFKLSENIIGTILCADDQGIKAEGDFHIYIFINLFIKYHF